MEVPLEIIAHVASFMPTADHLVSAIPDLYRMPLDRLQRMSVIIEEMILMGDAKIDESFMRDIGRYHPYPDRIAVNALFLENWELIIGLSKNNRWADKTSPHYEGVHFIADYFHGASSREIIAKYPDDVVICTYDIIGERYYLADMYARTNQ